MRCCRLRRSWRRLVGVVPGAVPEGRDPSLSTLTRQKLQPPHAQCVRDCAIRLAPVGGRVIYTVVRRPPARHQPWRRRAGPIPDQV
eukprot:7349258-Pyramimonas_sp.AAC.2